MQGTLCSDYFYRQLVGDHLDEELREDRAFQIKSASSTETWKFPLNVNTSHMQFSQGRGQGNHVLANRERTTYFGPTDGGREAVT